MKFLLLLIIGISLIIYGMLSIKREEDKFSRVLKDKENNMSNSGMELGELRKDIGETFTEIQRDILKLQEELNILKQSTAFLEKPHTHNIDENIIKGNKKEADNNFNMYSKESNKKDEIKKLLQDNESIDYICDKYKMGRGEVLLIRDLYTK
ncbi:hypothetical protein HAHI6034_09680 [Hathewaya histolytica]|uniref:Uncharacterized protein n=1 Tax=Hathewaya histolytica TaxID=1498 RepID=A0A4U9RC36_HATHI|nr:hypothetical protein [Hathewaya histolytica]VTQ87803.1 Uncharacterised protein [Hathewaya histolytica]